MDGKFEEKSMEFPYGGDTFKFGICYSGKGHNFDEREAYVAITSNGAFNGMPAGYALAVQIQEITLSGRPGEKMRHYRQKALEVLGRLNNGLRSVPSGAEFESIDGLVREAYKLGKR